MDIDWVTGVITVYKTDPFMAFQGGSVYDMDTNAFRLAVMAEEYNETGIIWPHVFSHNTVVTLGGIDYARIVEILSPYTVTFDDTGGGWVCNLLNSNNNILDVTNLTSVQVRSNNSAGLVGVREIQNTAYAQQVSIDVVNGVSGTTYPTGTHAQPSNNVTDAIVIAEARGIETLTVHGSYTLTTGEDVSGYLVKGENAITTFITVETDANVLNTQFADLFMINSSLDGYTYLDHCGLSNVSNMEGYVEGCMLTGNLSMTTSGSNNLYFVDCKSGCVGLGTTDLPKISMAGTDRHIAFRNFSGPIKVLDSTDPDNTICLDIGSGSSIILDSSCTAGVIFIRGIANVTNNSTMTVIDDAHADPVKVAEMYARLNLNTDNDITHHADGRITGTGINITATDDGSGGIITHRT